MYESITQARREIERDLRALDENFSKFVYFNVKGKIEHYGEITKDKDYYRFHRRLRDIEIKMEQERKE